MAVNPLMTTLKPQSNGIILHQYGYWYTLAVDGWHILVQQEGPGQAVAPSSPLIAVPNVTAHPSTASVYQLNIIRCGAIAFAL